MITYQSNRPAILRLRRDVADDEAVGAAGETPVRDQSALLRVGTAVFWPFLSFFDN